MQHADQVFGGRSFLERVRDLPRVGGRRRIEGDQRSDLDEREGAPVQAAALAIELTQTDRLLQNLEVAGRDSRQLLMRFCSNNSHLMFLSIELMHGPRTTAG